MTLGCCSSGVVTTALMSRDLQGAWRATRGITARSVVLYMNEIRRRVVWFAAGFRPFVQVASLRARQTAKRFGNTRGVAPRVFPRDDAQLQRDSMDTLVVSISAKRW